MVSIPKTPPQPKRLAPIVRTIYVNKKRGIPKSSSGLENPKARDILALEVHGSVQRLRVLVTCSQNTELQWQGVKLGEHRCLK